MAPPRTVIRLHVYTMPDFVFLPSLTEACFCAIILPELLKQTINQEYYCARFQIIQSHP